MKTALKIGALGASLLCAPATTASAAPVKNIVLVHGAFLDGSGWRPVYDILVRHSYGGGIITEAGVAPHVAALVYIAAHAPDEGETETGNGKRYPAAGRDAIQKTPDGYTYVDPARFHADFAADVPTDEAAFEARSQVFTAAKVFTTPITNPAWKLKPSWYMVARSDRIISPDLERMYAARAHSHAVEIRGASHSVYRSHPKEVAALIEQAALHAAERP